MEIPGEGREKAYLKVRREIRDGCAHAKEKKSERFCSKTMTSSGKVNGSFSFKRKTRKLLTHSIREKDGDDTATDLTDKKEFRHPEKNHEVLFQDMKWRGKNAEEGGHGAASSLISLADKPGGICRELREKK